jgi:hypothetical protein
MGESITTANAVSSIVSAAGCIAGTLSPCKEFVTGSKAIEIPAQVLGVRLRFVQQLANTLQIGRKEEAWLKNHRCYKN